MLLLAGPVTTGASRARADGFGPHPAPPTSGYGYVDRSGMNEHVVRGAYEGIATGAMIGFALTSANTANAEARIVSGAVLGGVAGIVLPLALNRGGKEVRSGDVVFLNMAENWGMAHGFFIPFLFQLSGARSFDISHDQLRLDFGLAAALSLGAGALAARASSDLNFTPGQSEMLGAAGLWGAASGVLLVVTLAPDAPGVGWAQAAIATGLVLADAAILTAWANRDSINVDRSRGILVHIGGILGVAVGIAGAYFINPSLDNYRIVTGSALVGALVGVGGGYYLSSGFDDFKQGVPPSNGGGGLSLFQLRNGRWTGGLPAPLPMAVSDASGAMRVRPMLSLANGRF